jgi:Ca2+-transporting ATPase
LHWNPLDAVQPSKPAQAHGFDTAGACAQQPPDLPWQWLGLLAFEDPLRPTVAAAVQQAQGAGIAVCLITGDHAQTALSIARQAGIDTQAGVMEGPAFEALEPEQQLRAVQRIRVFARVSPLTKLLLVQRAQAAGHVVAMTGDGVNDAPALKAAHIGVAMGRRGTDVAREASSLVLMREDFSHLVAAIEHGRMVFDNLRQVSGYIVSINVPLAGLAVMPLMWGWPGLMTPAHVVLTEMLIDPMCSLAFEAAPAAPQVMKRPPRQADQGLLDRQALTHCVVLGLTLLAILVCVWWAARTLEPEGSIEQQRTWVMSSLLAGNLTLVALHLGSGSWRALWGGVSARVFGVAAAAALALAALSLAWPALGHLLQLEPVAPSGLLGIMALTAAVLVAVQVWLLKR